MSQGRTPTPPGIFVWRHRGWLPLRGTSQQQERRNSGFVAASAEHRPGTSVFQFTDTSVRLKSGRPARCTLVAFVDDHFILGHPQVSRRLAALLECRNEYNEPFRPLALGALEPALGLEFRLNLTPLCVTLSISQGDYGRLWTGRFSALIVDKLGKRLEHTDTPGYAPGRMKCPSGGGILSAVARSNVSAAYWAARHSVVELLEPLNYLSTMLGDKAWSLQSDAGVMHAYAYWAKLLDTGEFHLDLRITREDALTRELWVNHYSDVDHASDYLRKSTRGSIALIESPTGQTRALLDAGCKQQPSVATSSAESETKALSDCVQDIAGVEHPTDDERDLIRRSADRVKALCTTTTRIAYPLDDLLKCVTLGRAQLRYGRLYVDATAAKAIAETGESRAFAYMKKSQAVDLLWL